MGQKLLDVDPVTRTREIFHFDSEGDEFWVEEVADVEPVLEVNKALYAQTDERAPYGEWQRVASIPLIVYFQWLREGVFDDPRELKRRLNDSDNRFFRTRPGRV